MRPLRKEQTMNEKLETAKTFVKKHKTAIACTTGLAVGATVTYFALTTNRIVLKVDDTAAEKISTGDAAICESKFGTLLVALETYLPED